jgi:CHAT domain-containing protein
MARGEGEAARLLYDAVLGPVESLLAGRRRFVFVPDGALQSVPPTLLVGGEPASVLARRFAVTVMPSIPSIAAVSTAAPSTAARAFLGIGNPLLPGGGQQPAGSSELWQRLSELEPLPETEAELTRIAQLFPDAADTELLVGAGATKAAIAHAGPVQFRILAFATHAVMAGNLPGVPEPAVILTPDRDNPAAGLLTASDVAAMSLDADLVLLSACNTAAPDGGPYAEGLSGLARAFLHAGARSLLVSHWAVNSMATVQLMTRFMMTLRADPAQDKAAAMQAAILSFLNGPDAGMRDPAVWAPFVVIGP